MAVYAGVITYTNKADFIDKLRVLLESLGWTTNSAGPPLIMTTPADPQGRTVCIKVESTTGASSASVIRLNVAGYLTAGDLTAPVITRDFAMADSAGTINLVGNEYWFCVYNAATLWLMGGMFNSFSSKADDPYPFFCGGSRSTGAVTDQARAIYAATTNYFTIAIDGTVQMFGSLSSTVSAAGAYVTATRRGAAAGGFDTACFVGTYVTTAANSETRGTLPHAITIGSDAAPVLGSSYTYQSATFKCLGDTIAPGSGFTSMFVQISGS